MRRLVVGATITPNVHEEILKILEQKKEKNFLTTKSKVIEELIIMGLKSQESKE